MIRRLLFVFLALLLLSTELAGQTPKYPGSVATLQDLLQAYDRMAGELGGSIDASTLSIPVANDAPFAGAEYFSVTIDDERILVCSVSGSTLNVCPGGRGFAGSTAAPHSAGAPVRGNVTAWHHNALVAEIIATQTALGPNLSNVVKTSGSYTDPDWLTISKSKVGLGNVENTALSTWTGSSNITTVGTITSGTIPWARLSDVPSSFTPSAHAANHAAGGSDPITSLGGVSFTSSIQVAGYVKAQKQYSFKIYDDSTALPHKTYTDIWWPELGNVTVNSVSCKADTADAVIQFTGITLAANLTCGQATKNSTTNLTDATLTTSETLGVQLISGTAKSITVSLVVTQQ